MVLSHKFLFKIKCWISNIGLVLKIRNNQEILWLDSWVALGSKVWNLFMNLFCVAILNNVWVFEGHFNCPWVEFLPFLSLVSFHNSLLGRGETSLNKLAKLLWYKYLFVYHPLADGEKLLILYSGDRFHQTRQECKNENIFRK